MSETQTKKRRVKLRAGQQLRFAVAEKTSTFGNRVSGYGLSINETLRRDVMAVRAASRKAGEDDSYVVRFLSMAETHIVGHNGFKLQVKAKKANGDLDEEANQAIENAFTRWGKKGVCDVTGQYSWKDIQRLFIRTVAQDGACLVREVPGFPNEFGYALQLLECDHLDINYSKDDYNGNTIRHGVELNEWGRHVAYHVLTNRPGDSTYHTGNTRYLRIPAEEIIFGFYPFRIGQTIGVPWAHAALIDLLDLYNYREAEMTSARTAASKMFVYEPDSDVEPDDGEDDEEFVEELEPGGGIVAPYGYSVKALDFKADGANAANFTKTGLRAGASGLDVSYNSLANDGEGVNFSSLRHFALDDRDNWKKRQEWMKETLCERIFSNFLKMAMLTRQVPYSLREYERLNAPAFQGRRWDWMNPLQDEKANSEAISNRTRSPQGIIRERGEDPNEVLREIDEWHEKTKHLQPARQVNTDEAESETTDDKSSD